MTIGIIGREMVPGAFSFPGRWRRGAGRAALTMSSRTFPI